MKFEVRQRYDATAAEVMRHYASAEMYDSIPEFGRISRPTVVDRAETGDLVTLRHHYKFTADLPSAALAVIDPAKLTWIDETVYDFAAQTSTTRLLPDHYSRKLEASARSHFGDSGGACVRNVSGSLKVHVLLVGGQVEKAIVSGLTEHLEEEAGIVAGLLI